MSRPNAPEFDQYARHYNDMHRASIRASGEEPSYFSRYKARYMAANLGRIKSGQPLDLLDFGCGVGNSIPHLRDAFPHARLHGVDPSGESIQVAASAHGDTASFQVGADDKLPYGNGSFDLIQVACVFHHIRPGERDLWMRELKRVLRPSGDLFVFEHNMLNPLTVRAVRECPFDEDAILLPKRELLGLTRSVGFNAVSARYIVFFPRALGFMRPIEPLMGSIPLGAQYTVHAVA